MNEDFYVEGIIRITDEEFKLISSLVYERFGINLTEKKKALVTGRLNKLIKNLKLKTFKEYYNFVINDLTNKSLLDLVDRISTNHTFFFRENDHFDYLINNVFPELFNRLKNEKLKELRIWCAGCASGEEPYTLAVILNEYFREYININESSILATDISMTALNKANHGIFSFDRIKQTSLELRNKYFKPIDKEKFIIDDRLRKLIMFKRFNLMNETFPFKNKFHIIFCRNVMIYFDKITRNTLVNKFYDCTFNNGYLFIGHSESLDRRDTNYKYIKPAVYKKEY